MAHRDDDVHDKASKYDALVFALTNILKKETPIRIQYEAGTELCDGHMCYGVGSAEEVIKAIITSG